jgi:hypothetical protein
LGKGTLGDKRTGFLNNREIRLLAIKKLSLFFNAKGYRLQNLAGDQGWSWTEREYTSIKYNRATRI